MAADHKATLRDYVDLFDAAAQRIQDNTTRTQLDDGSREWRHTRITGQSVSRLADSPSVYHGLGARRVYVANVSNNSNNSNNQISIAPYASCTTGK